ncbi:DUF3570 domain-containing protein [uncultured Bacteroides sp.]|uniref:DUF3570 domain-containing protein n=1 Tax=uncultured Bacteroides sp. TaxID=162156 RepID=UPI002AAB3CC8|nr:DUF3570 domain-containing protein [uncultured Bacteroides sp.]
MKKLVMTVAAFMFFMNVAKAQSDSTAARKLKIDEVNFVTSYYNQSGDHSAVTGGIGNEHLNDFGNSIDLQLSRFDKKLNKHTWNFELGVDVYSSASSDKIDPSTVSSASSGDARVSPTASYLFENTKKKYALGGGLSFSKEFDYTSFGGNLLYSKSTKDGNTQFSAKASVFLDTWKILLPIELRGTDNNGFKYKQGDSAPRNSYNLALGLTQVVNRELQVSLLADIGYQTGQLGTAYQRVYFDHTTPNSNQPTVFSEKMPDHRFKLPIGVRANYFLSDRFILRSFYRFYTDSWHLTAHTAELEVPYKITPFMSIAPYYRFYTQNGVGYFKPMGEHMLSDNANYYTSDYDLSKFNSSMVGLNFRVMSTKGLFGIKALNTMELRYGYYSRNDGLKSHLVTAAFKFK